MPGLKEFGDALLDGGYNIIPIKDGKKYPGFNDWQKVEADEAKLKGWLSNGHAKGGVGVLTRWTPAADLDVYDEDLVDKLVGWCEEHIGATVQRVGYAPKKLLAYRCDKPFKKVCSHSYIDFMGERNRVEILGDGQQFVAYSIHPDTGKPYKWVSAEGLADVKMEDLPIMTEADAFALIEYFENEIVPMRDDWVLDKGSSRSRRALGRGIEGVEGSVGGGDVLDHVKRPVDISTEELKRCLKHLSSEDRDRWIQVGMALWHQYGGGDEGFELWDLWSQHMGGEYPGRSDLRWRWDGFGADLGTVNPITARSIVKWAREKTGDIGKVEVEGKKVEVEMDLGGFIERFRFIGEGPQVADMMAPRNTALRNMAEFRVWVSPYKTEIPDPIASDPERMKKVPTSGLWLASSDRKDLRGVGFEPGAHDIVSDDYGEQWFNSYQSPTWNVWEGEGYEEGDEEKWIGIFMEHMEYLFPVKEEREFFLNWMTFTLRYPGRRCKFTPLLVSTFHGTGRGFLVELMQKLLGVDNTSVVKMGQMCEENGFQDYLYKSVFCAVHEVREGKTNPFAISDAVRDILTEDHLNLNLKYGKNGMQPIYVNFMLMSNHVDALKLGEEDRRLWVSVMRDEPKNGEYYTRLYGWKNKNKGDMGVRALYSYLMKRDIGGWNGAGRAPMTWGKRQMIAAGESITKGAFLRLIESPPVDLMSAADVLIEVRKLVAEEDQNEALKITQGEVNHLLKENCSQLPGRGKEKVRAVKVTKRDGKKNIIRPWVLAKREQWEREDGVKCKNEIERLYLDEEIEW